MDTKFDLATFDRIVAQMMKPAGPRVLFIPERNVAMLKLFDELDAMRRGGMSWRRIKREGRKRWAKLPPPPPPIPTTGRGLSP